MKQTKITIILDQPLQGPHTEEVTRMILGDSSAYGVYKSFSQDRVWVEEIDNNIKKTEEGEIIVKLSGGYKAHILEDEIVFSNYNIKTNISELSFDDFEKIREAYFFKTL